MKKRRADWTIDETWANYQALKSIHERRIELHARLCLHYAPVAKYLALRHLPYLIKDEQPPLLIAVAWLELSRAINDWSESGEGDFRDQMLWRVRDKLVKRVNEINN